jgi:histidyl-tRNA synthetase
LTRYTALTGFQDVLPEDQPYWELICGHASELARRFGFERIDLPILEVAALFTRGVGAGTDIVDKEMYTFQDRDGTQIALRPEFTAGVIRAYIEHGMHLWPQPVKLYTIGPIFRHEKPQAGRFRQHTQFNVEILGEADPAADLEVMLLAWQLFSDLGFHDLSFQINSTGDPKCKPGYIQVLVDYYRQHWDEIDEDCKRRLDRAPLRVLDCKAGQCQPIIANAPKITDYLCDECAAHFAQLRAYLDDLGKPYSLNHRLVRGLDYYTRTVFEVWAQGIGAQAAVCGGGRYDGLAELLGGPPTPGVGFGLGIERNVLLMKAQGLAAPPLPAPRVMVLHLGQAAYRQAVRLADQLRQAGIGTWLAFGERGLKSQLREASKRNIAYAIILGEEELKRGVAAVRDMAASSQSEVPLLELERWLSERQM